MINNFKAVFLDAGGTLLYPFPSVGEIYKTTAEKYGCRAEAKKLDVLFREAWLKRDGLTHLASHSSEKIEREWWRGLVHEIFTAVGGVDDFENFFHELYDVFGSPQAWKLYPEVIEVLKELNARGKKVAIISNWDSRLLRLCAAFEIDRHVELILASAVFGASKPSPKIFEHALKQTGVRAEEAVHIGDSLEDDIHGAKRAGIHAILIDRHPVKRPPEKVPTISDLKELLD